MIKCNKCQTENPDNLMFCQSCGNDLQQNAPEAQPAQPAQQVQPVQPQYQQPAQPQYQQPVQPQYQQPVYQAPYGATANTTGLLVWSIINIVLCGGGIFGIIALIFTINAKKCFTEQEFKSKTKTAKILNIVATVLAVVGIIFYIVMFAIGMSEGFDNYSSYGYSYYY